MTLNFPASPSDQDTYSGYAYNAAKGVWKKIAPTTDGVSEGSTNLYFTDQRALDATASAYDAAGSAATAEADAVSTANSYTDTTVADYAPLAGATFSGNVVLSADPTQALGAATKQYVDSLGEGLQAKPSVKASTHINATGTYNNGTAGVGATFTFPAMATFNIDGITSWDLDDGLLLRSQTNDAENGSYVLTTVGDVSTPWVFTRGGLVDEADEIPGAYIFVTGGSTSGQTGWVLHVDDPSTFTVGTDDVDVYQFAGAGTYTAGNGLDLTGTQFSIDNAVTATQTDLSNAQAAAESYADGLATNYDPAGSAATAESNANTYTDGRETAITTAYESYTDTTVADYAPLAGATLSGDLLLNADPTQALQAATKQYVDKQSIMVFADTTARDAAITSPTEGMFTYLTGDNLLTNYDGSAWQEFTSGGGGGVTVSATAPAGPDDGALWWDSTNGKLYLYYNDGSSSQWVAAADSSVLFGSGGGGVTVSDTAPASPEDGALWLDSTDGSMYVYYTEPGEGDAQWIGAVTRSGAILQVVSTTKTDAFSTTSTSFTDVTGLTASITPRSTSSKIYATLTINTASAGSAANPFRLVRDSTPIGVSTAGSTYNGFWSSNLYQFGYIGADILNINFNYLDSPNSLASVTYSAQCLTTSGAGLFVNRPAANQLYGGSSTITLMEVAG